MCYGSQPRRKVNQQYAKRRFNQQVNSVSRVNRTLNKRGGIKL